jgi:hypothetical protein
MSYAVTSQSAFSDRMEYSRRRGSLLTVYANWTNSLHHASPEHSPRQKSELIICNHFSSSGDFKNHTIYGYFNEAGLWEDCVVQLALYDLTTANMSHNSLDTLLRNFSTDKVLNPVKKMRTFDLVSRKTVAVLLACSLLQLSGTPWLQNGFETENIFLLPKTTAASRLENCRPHIFCRFQHDSTARSLAEDVAALGVLILEMENNESAGWTDDDEDYETGERSNRNRLNRILKDWKGDLTDFYHSIGSACLLFESLVEDFEHAKVREELRKLFILYKCVVNPLYQKLVSDFGGAERMFRGMSGLSVPSTQKRGNATDHMILYDDSESIKSDER